jgi:hypothetical protein
MKSRVKEIVEQGDKLFSRRSSAGIDQLWQTQAEQFNPMRADFTVTRNAGDEFASHLMTGRPMLAHRDLSNAISAMLRPRGVAWFNARTDNEDLNNDATVKAWLDAKCDTMRRMMYAQGAQFLRATKQGDNDFVAFGQCVIEVTPNMFLDGVLYRSWHLRDVAWCENDELVIDTVHRNWKLEARALMRRFGDKCAPQVKQIVDKEPYKEINCRHVMLPADDYDLKVETRGRKLPYVSLIIDVDNETVLEEKPAKRISYVIPRWVTVSGSQYAYSPCTVAALPDARLLQQMTLTLLEAGQKAVDPPMKATREGIVGGVNMFAGGITWADSEYDERMGAALEPMINPNLAGLDWGERREEAIERMIQEAFFLNVINLPESQGGDKMTAYETQKRVEEYIRRALPLFEPMEVEYNGRICEQTWQVAMDLGAFGSFEDMPKVLSRKEIEWRFESPLQASNDRIKSEAFIQASALLAQAAQIDPNVRYDVDISTAFRDALAGIVPAKWIVPEEQANQQKANAAQAAAAAQQAQDLASGADVASQMAMAVKNAGEAGSAVREALAPDVAA